MASHISKTSAQEQKSRRSSYSYRSLHRPRQEIRVLEVLPGSGCEPLHAKFVSECLRDDFGEGPLGPYETISYAWGDSTLRDEIEIDGSVIDIPASSAAALRCMRLPDVSRRLWIDAVCINQDDISERNFQVTIMGEIYRRSNHNLVYLGEEDATTKSAIASITRAVEELDTRPGTLEKLRDIIDRGPPLECEIDVAAVTRFLNRPWFRRMWVVQEVVFAPISTCYCGTDIRISLLNLLRASTYIFGFHGSTFTVARSREESELPTLYSCVQIWSFVDPKGRQYVSRSQDGSIKPGESACRQLMYIGSNRLCIDPRDKIFSIVGLIDHARAKASREDGADRALLEVDYGKPIEHVLRDAVRFCIQESRDLEIWHYLRPRSSIKSGELLLEGFCSWVPRLDLEESILKWPSLAVNFRACAKLRIRREAMEEMVDSNVLTLEGYVVAQITEVSQPLEAHLFTDTARLADMLTSIHRMCSGVESYDPTRPIPFPEVLARTLTVSPYRDSEGRYGRFLTLQNHVYSVVDGNLSNDESEYWSEEVRFMFKKVCQNRRIFIGSDGYTGQGPSYLRAGDRIVVLLGSHYPIAVRPLSTGHGVSGEQFHVLGRVYVYGAMYGECVDAAKARGEEPSPFHFE